MKSTNTSNKSSRYDAIIIGGGPAGSTTATLLAQKGYRPLVLEKTIFPRFSIGESLLPECYWPLKRLGMLEKMKNSHFVKKYSVQFVTHTGKETVPFYFFDANPHESSQTWQVKRAEFDEMMLENAAEQGAEVRQGVQVKDVLFEDGRAVGVLARSADGQGEDEQIRARVVVDASGRNGFLSRRLHMRLPYPKLDKVAIFAHYENVERLPGIDGGATICPYIRDKLGWFWFIPLHDNVVSIGVVASPPVLYQDRPKDPEKILEQEIELCGWVKAKLAQARRITEVRVLSDYSYRSRQCAGDGWVLVGDAFGFLDPIYSSGVLLAMKSGEFAADAIDEAYETGDFTGARLGRFGPMQCKGMETFRGLVNAFYDSNFSFGRFIREFPEHRKTITQILSGDIYGDEVLSIFPALAKFIELPAPLPLEQPGVTNGGVKV